MTTLLSAVEHSCDFSFIIPTRNNQEELKATIKSISAEAPENSELVVVDGSDLSVGFNFVQALIPSGVSLGVVYVLDNKCGVYDAMNVGVKSTHGRWLIMVPAGDRINRGARRLLYSLRNSKLDAVVFAQDLADPKGKKLYSFIPTDKTIWPHQSVILRRTVHERFGLYPEEYRYSSDQFFFAMIRSKICYEIRAEVISTFLLGGISSGASLKRSREWYVLRRELGEGRIPSLLRAYIFPYLRAWLERLTGFDGIASKLRVWTLKNYRRAD
jgi:glycosyltransferase involved in cell wall biosynthesis